MNEQEESDKRLQKQLERARASHKALSKKIEAEYRTQPRKWHIMTKIYGNSYKMDEFDTEQAAREACAEHNKISGERRYFWVELEKRYYDKEE
jgi:hypothetical protein